MKAFFRNLLLPLAAAAAALLLVLAGLGLVGYPPFVILREWIVSAAGTRLGLAASFQEACPLLLTGLAAGVAFRGGVLNIGAEGQFMVGALASVAVTTRLVPPGPAWLVILLALIAGTLAGALWAAIAAVLNIWRGVPVVLSTILLNFIALQFLGVMLNGPLQAPGTHSPQSAALPLSFQLPVLLANTQFHIGILLAGLVAVAAWIVQARTVFGFELLVTGLNPTAASLAGMPVIRRRLAILFISGGFAGLGGAIEVAGVSHFLSDASAGYGYAGIAVALLGRLDPLGIAAAALFFGLLDTGAAHVERDYTLGVPHSVADIVKGVIILAMLIGTAWRLGRPRPIQTDDTTSDPPDTSFTQVAAGLPPAAQTTGGNT